MGIFENDNKPDEKNNKHLQICIYWKQHSMVDLLDTVKKTSNKKLVDAKFCIAIDEIRSWKSLRYLQLCSVGTVEFATT